MTQERIRIAIIGTGANGASIGADMIRAGHDVTFIEQWPAHVEAMRDKGLTVHVANETQTTPVRVFHLCEVAGMRETFDIVFTSVKSYDTRWIAELVKPIMREDSVFVGLQNGMTIDAAAEILGEHRSIGAVLGIAANMYTPGEVVRQTTPAETWFSVGTMSGERTERLGQVAEALSASGYCEISDDIRSSKWMKLIANVPEMLPSAILNVPLLTAAAVPGMRAVMDAAAREAYALAIDLGITMLPVLGKTAADVPPNDQYAVDLLDTILEYFSKPDTRVAVLQDWTKHRRAELDAYSGYIVEKRRERGERAPVNEMILRVAERIERGELAPGESNAQLLIRSFEELYALT